MSITFLYNIIITKFLDHWKACCEGYVILYLKWVNNKFFKGLKVLHYDLGFWLESLMMDDAILLLDVLLSCDKLMC
jgi:hypothetical protein